MRFFRRSASTSLTVGLVLALATTGLGMGKPLSSKSSSSTEASVTRLTTEILEHSQFSHHAFDEQMARTLIDRYMDALDGRRSLFLQSDAAELTAYAPELARASHGDGDTRVARLIFKRFLERLQERATYVKGALQTARFDFSGHDVYSFDRAHAERPRDAAAAQALWFQELRAGYLGEKLGDKRAETIASTLAQRYDQQVRAMRALTSDEVLEGYLETLAHVYDPHSDYFDHDEMDSFSIAMNLSLVGIGATLESKDGHCLIRELVPGGPAARGHRLKAGDRIVAVAQAGGAPVDITYMPLSRAVELIRGAKGTTVTLKVVPAGAPDGAAAETVSVVRDAVRLADQEAKARIIDLPAAQGTRLRLGVIDLPSFYSDMGDKPGTGRSATADVAALLGKLKAEGVRGVVLDLRRNGGGSLQEAVSLTGLFIRTGPVVQTRDQTGIAVDSDDDPAVLYDGPLVVLTSRYTASASEIVAGALKDYGRALLVGDASTFGKGTVQNVLPLGRIMDQAGLPHSYDPGALKVTTSKFYRPGGASTQLRGVASDVVIPSMSDVSDVNESTLDNPLPWDAVRAAPHADLNRVEPYLDVLRAESARRVAGEKEFHELADAVAQVKKTLASKSVSLNEAERRQELAEAKARRAEEDREARSFDARRPTTYPVTLENLSTPGLPAPSSSARAPAAAEAIAGEEPSVNVDALDDVVLDEGTHVLADYVGLLSGEGARAAR